MISARSRRTGTGSLRALMALNILKGYSFTDRSCVDTVHKQLEAMKLAFADGNRYVADPGVYARAPVGTLLSDEYADGRRSLIGDGAQTRSQAIRSAEERSISAQRTGKATWYPTSRAITWDLDPGS